MTFHLSRIRVQGFRSLRDVEFKPERVSVLIGPNGAGKSNLLSFLHMIPLLRTRSLGRFVGEAGGASALLFRGQKVTRELAFELDFAQPAGTNRYSARLGYAGDDTFVFLQEEVGFRPNGENEFRTYQVGESAGHRESQLEEEAQKPGATTAKLVRECLARMNFYHFHDTSLTSALRANSRADDSRYLRSDGSNLAAYLLALKSSSDSDDVASSRRILALLRRVAPFIKDLIPTFVGVANAATVRDGNRQCGGAWVRLRWVDANDAEYGPHQLSDGTLRALALITALAQPTLRLPRLICVDEPELGLHPTAVGLLVELARIASRTAQILLATQSPLVLDHFAAAEAVVCEQLNGESKFERLQEEELAGWLKDYRLSEVYEKNIFGGRP